MRLNAELGTLAAACLFASSIQAQNFPTKPILISLPQQAGSGTKVMLRLTSQKMLESMKQLIVPINIPGAGGSIGAERVANSPPDGYTVSIASACNA